MKVNKYNYNIKVTAWNLNIWMCKTWQQIVKPIPVYQHTVKVQIKNGERHYFVIKY